MMSDGLTPRVRDIAAIVAGQGSRSPLTYLLTEAGVRPAASASSFWLMPRFLSRAARLTPISSVNQYPFLVDDAPCVLIISMEWFPKK